MVVRLIRTYYHTLEVDPHNDPPEGGLAYLREPGGGEDAAAADVELSPGDLLQCVPYGQPSLASTPSSAA